MHVFIYYYMSFIVIVIIIITIIISMGTVGTCCSVFCFFFFLFYELFFIFRLQSLFCSCHTPDFSAVLTDDSELVPSYCPVLRSFCKHKGMEVQEYNFLLVSVDLIHFFFHF